MSSKIKILFDANPIIAQRKSGIGYYLENLILNLIKYHGDQLNIEGFYFNFFNRKNIKNEHIKFIAIKHFPGKLVSFLRTIGINILLELIVFKKTNISMFTNYVYYPSIFNKKVVSFIYDLGFVDFPEYCQEKNLKFLKKYVPKTVKKSSLIVTISDFSKKRLLEIYPFLKEDKILVTPIPPPENKVAQYEISSLKNKSYILYLGTIEPRKNITNLVKSYSQLNKDLTDRYYLVIAGGKGWKDENILNTIDSYKNIGLNIISTGYISDAEKCFLYTNASVFVMPSHYEGFGMPVLEAMSYDVPVCVSDIPVFHEVAGDAALYFDKDNPVDIAQKIEKCLDKTTRDILIQKGRQQLKKYSWEATSRLVYDAIKSLAKS